MGQDARGRVQQQAYPDVAILAIRHLSPVLISFASNHHYVPLLAYSYCPTNGAVPVLTDMPPKPADPLHLCAFHTDCDLRNPALYTQSTPAPNAQIDVRRCHELAK